MEQGDNGSFIIGHLLCNMKGVKYMKCNITGRNLEITESINYQEADLKQAAKYNTAIVESVKLPVERKTFFKKLKKSDYSAAHTAAKKRHLVDAIKRRIIKR